MLDNFTEVYTEGVEVLRLLRFDGANNVHRVVTSLYATIMEQAHDTLTLLHDGNQSTVDIIMRSSLEAYADLINLTNDASYIGNMNASFHHEWIRLAREGVEGQNPWMGMFANDPIAVQRLNEHRLALTELAATPRLQINQKFERANLGHMYASVYNNLCSESHNNLRSLTERHFTVVNGQLEMTYLKDRSQESINASLTIYSGIVVDSTIIVNNYFGSPADDLVARITARHQAALAAQSSQLDD